MTDTAIHHDRTGGLANNRPPEVVMWLDGRFGPVPAYRAWSEWLALLDSPIPASRERAAAIRASLNEIGYLNG